VGLTALSQDIESYNVFKRFKVSEQQLWMYANALCVEQVESLKEFDELELNKLNTQACFSILGPSTWNYIAC